ncbi:hypothetical protein, partial [Streptomyces sp. NTH33]|uniref:hypothetical protein n=1 Tax=Streptomyces sp. NTH33 TaxID=1735453 RepID=UPI001C646421
MGQIEQGLERALRTRPIPSSTERALSPFLIAATSGLLEESLANESSQPGAGDVDRGLVGGQA